jgi:hypothetical protein
VIQAPSQQPRRHVRLLLCNFVTLHVLIAKTVGGIGGLNSMAQYTKGIITLQAKPEAIAIELTMTVMIVVDMQNDFGT